MNTKNLLVRHAVLPYSRGMEDGKITVRAPKEMILKLKSVLALKDTSITKWLRQKIQEEINKQD